MSDYLANALLNHVLKVQAFTPPEKLYLDVQDPPADPNYKRQRITFTAAAWSEPSPLVYPNCVNNEEIRFPIARQSWGTFNLFHIYDAPTGGNQLFYDIQETITVPAGEQLVIEDGQLKIEFNAPQASGYILAKLLNMALRGESFSMSGIDIKMALCTTAPPWYEQTGFTEISGGGYSSVVANDWGAAVAAAIKNDASIDFGPVTDPDGWDDEIAAFVLFEGTTGNKNLFFGDAGVSTPLSVNDVLQYVSENVTVSLYQST
jgi:hypothetical protein